MNLSLGIGLFWLATALIEVGGQHGPIDEQLYKIMYHASARLERVAQRRPFRFAAMNDSLTKTSEAIHLMLTSNQTDLTLQWLSGARQDYEDNHFTFLLEAVVANAGGDVSRANSFFERFLLESRTYTDFDASFLEWSEFHQLRRMVYELLKSRGVSFEGREKEIQVIIPFEEFIRYLTHPKGQDVFLSVFFVVFLLGGAVLFVLAGLTSFAFVGHFTGNLPVVYGAAWLAYAFWLLDLALGIPFHGARNVIVPALLGSSLAFLVFSGFLKSWQEQRRPLEEGYRRCPRCKAVILELLIECPECGSKIESGKT
ncbi:MAG TPA: hypothetical protein VD913_00005 [bacterium]|nr:hypothetical protein [bacterium]